MGSNPIEILDESIEKSALALGIISRKDWAPCPRCFAQGMLSESDCNEVHFVTCDKCRGKKKVLTDEAKARVRCLFPNYGW